MSATAPESSSPQPPPPVNCLYGGKYLVVSACEASALFKCIDKDTLDEYVCKVLPSKYYQDYLSTFFRLDGMPGFNGLEEVLVGPAETLVVFEPSYGDLHSYVRTKRRLSEVEAARLFHQIVAIVATAHRNGIVLRDLKLRKFVFQDPERTKIKLETLDDAILLRPDGNDWLSDKHGCPAYVSPELLSSVTGGYSGRSADCWSLGIILYTLLVGRYPFHDLNASLLFGKIRRGSFYVPATLSPLAKCLIRSLIRREPGERMTADDLLASKWFPLMTTPESGYCKHHQLLQTELEQFGGGLPWSSGPPGATTFALPYALDERLATPAEQVVPVMEPFRCLSISSSSSNGSLRNPTNSTGNEQQLDQQLEFGLPYPGVHHHQQQQHHSGLLPARVPRS